ncbi:DNA cytosine methyltransferase [Marinospirillum insulare]|uniref:DNA (cytosine-5-)-methyltransferase n=1 Tax=Marinospirillum insulare TaxID=217169 RepID=A0ABQ6A0W2_9GAMM|nr:DNA cytosine methyltransferase [Marinospirillum insulare]GLR65297.1 cytosine-specific methyltransferase [Marinospirillum insulare]
MTQKRSLISLFAGAGGLDLGLEQAGFTTIVANELEPQACETLRKNKMLCNLNSNEVDTFVEEALKQPCFKRLSEIDKQLFFQRIKTRTHKEKYLQECKVIEGDIREVPSSEFERLIDNDLFCIAGGPPCQPFSKAGKQKSLDCTKNGDLFYEFVRLVKDLNPKWFLFENVKGITFTKTDVIYQTCNSCHSESLAPFEVRQNFSSQKDSKKCIVCGDNDATWDIRNEAGGSLKIIFNEFEKLGYKCSHKVLNAADFGAPQIRERLIIVGSRDGLDFDWPEATHGKPNKKQQQEELFSGSELRPWVTMYDALWPGTHPIYGEINSEKARLWVKNVVRPHDEPVTWTFDRPSPTIGAHQGAKLAFAPNGVPEKQLFRQQWATKGRKQGDTPPVPVEHEYLSDEELLKLQTFPASWYLHGTRMQRAFQIGNAVPPLLGKIIGNAILEAEEKYGS